MPKFNCSYAYDLRYYCDFVVEADTKAKALRIIRKALKSGKFESVEGESDGSSCNHRVFVLNQLDPSSPIDRIRLDRADTLEELIDNQ